MSGFPPMNFQRPDPPYVEAALQHLAEVMGYYARRLNEILPHSPYTAPQLTDALAHIRATGGELTLYERQLEQNFPGSTAHPRLISQFAYHRDTFAAATNTYESILRSVSSTSMSAPSAMGVSPPDQQDEIRRLYAGCCRHCGEYLGNYLYVLAICPRCHLYPTV